MKISNYINSIPNCQNKIIAITGANSGIGFEAMKILAAKGAQIIMACRNLKRAEDAKNKALSDIPNAKIDILIYDQSSFLSIDNFIKVLQEKYSHIDYLVCNAGIYHPKKNQKTIDGYPLTIGTNYLGLFYLIENLKSYLVGTKIIFVNSLVYNRIKRFKYEELSTETTSIFNQYCFSKLAITNYFYYLSKSTDLNIYLMHPGVSSTNIFTSPTSSYKNWFKKLAKVVLPLFVHSPTKACLGIVNLCAKDYPNHTFLAPRGLKHISGYPKVCHLNKKRVKFADEFYRESYKLVFKEEQNVNSK